MTEAQTMLALADEYQAGLRKMERAGYEDLGKAIDDHRLVIKALRASASAVKPDLDDRQECAFVRLRGATERMLIVLQHRSDRHYEIALQAIESAMREYRAATPAAAS